MGNARGVIKSVVRLSYQRSWQLTHELSEDNVQAANTCSERLRALQEVCRRDATGIAFINRDAGALPKLAEELNDLVTLTGMLFFTLLYCSAFLWDCLSAI